MPDSSLCFGRLAKATKLVLGIPHSNAEEECVFNGPQEQNSLSS